MVPQQVQNILRHLKEVHNIEKHLVSEALSTEMDELLALRARVEIDHKDYKILESQVASIYSDAVNKHPFVRPSGPPEDELVSACV